MPARKGQAAGERPGLGGSNDGNAGLVARKEETGAGIGLVSGERRGRQQLPLRGQRWGEGGKDDVLIKY